MGLDWDAIRKNYTEAASPKELDGPFMDNGLLKGDTLRAINKANAQTVQSRSRKKPNAIPPQRSGGLRKNVLSDEAKDKICNLYTSGEAISKIAKTLGLSDNGVRRVLKIRGVYQAGRDLGRRYD